MSRADRAWCEKAAGEHFWDSWERANRHDINPLQAEAERRARQLPKPSQRRKGMAA